ncbi:hypothetical protein SAMN05192562_101973 [Kosakonia arachidis]|uniref:Uncharacterized protein n=1 Tax=Kosakonia arachidis TaxID=551989 RepID=A0A1I6Z645_9ENTR|nr:hypothetical protein SAMN05192562_101973 [Kosakonia arachidis]
MTPILSRWSLTLGTDTRLFDPLYFNVLPLFLLIILFWTIKPQTAALNVGRVALPGEPNR